MAEVYAPKVDLVGRGVHAATASVQDDLLRANLLGESTLGVAGDLRLSQIIMHLSGSGDLAGLPTANYGIDAALAAESALVNLNRLRGSFGVGLLGEGLIGSEPARSHLSGAGTLDGVLTGGQGVVFVTRHLSASGAIAGTFEPIDHSVSLDMSATGHLGLAGDTSESLDPVALTGESTFDADAGYVPGYDSRVTQLTGHSELLTRMRKQIPISAHLVCRATFGVHRKVVPISGTSYQTSSATAGPEALTVVPDSHERAEPIEDGHGDLRLSSGAQRLTIDEPSVESTEANDLSGVYVGTYAQTTDYAVDGAKLWRVKDNNATAVPLPAVADGNNGTVLTGAVASAGGVDVLLAFIDSADQWWQTNVVPPTSPEDWYPSGLPFAQQPHNTAGGSYSMAASDGSTIVGFANVDTGDRWFRSHDAGETWLDEAAPTHTYGTPQPIDSVAYNAGRFYRWVDSSATESAGTFKIDWSTDGINWTTIDTGLTGLRSVRVAYLGDQKWSVLSTSNDDLYGSVDDFATNAMVDTTTAIGMTGPHAMVPSGLDGVGLLAGWDGEMRFARHTPPSTLVATPYDNQVHPLSALLPAGPSVLSSPNPYFFGQVFSQAPTDGRIALTHTDGFVALTGDGGDTFTQVLLGGLIAAGSSGGLDYYDATDFPYCTFAYAGDGALGLADLKATSSTIRLTVDEPSIEGFHVEAIADQTAGEGDAVSIPVITSNAADPPPTLSATNLPAGLGLTDNGDGTGTISGTVTAGAGTGSPYTVEITGTDGNGQPHTVTFEFIVGLPINLAAAEGQSLTKVEHTNLSSVEGQSLTKVEHTNLSSVEGQSLTKIEHTRVSSIEVDVLIQN